MFEWIKNSNQSLLDSDSAKTADSGDSNKVDTDQHTPVHAFDNSTADYTIGINRSGYTQLRVQMDYSSATLTMSPTAVLRLIRLLEATLEESDHTEEEIK